MMKMIVTYIRRWRYEHAMKVALRMLHKLEMDVTIGNRLEEWRKYREDDEE